jgi:SET domain-containing protein
MTYGGIPCLSMNNNPFTPKGVQSIQRFVSNTFIPTMNTATSYCLDSRLAYLRYFNMLAPDIGVSSAHEDSKLEKMTWGVFATETIRADRPVLLYSGEHIRTADAKRRYFDEYDGEVFFVLTNRGFLSFECMYHTLSLRTRATSRSL